MTLEVHALGPLEILQSGRPLPTEALRNARLYEDGLDALAAYHEAREDHGAAAEVLRRLVSTDTLHEDGVRRLMHALDRDGRRHEALRAFQRLESELAAELGVAPESETARLAERIRRSEGD